MKRKIFGILFALVMTVSLMLVPAAVSASPGSPPTIDGVISTGEWDGAVAIPVASGMGTVSVIADTNYMYVLFDVVDVNDARTQYLNEVGNDQISININPTSGGPWGFPYDLIFETSALPVADGGHHILPWNPKVNSGTIDGWATRWFPNNTQQTLPVSLASATVYSGGKRVTEWKMPLASSAAPKVGGAIDVGDGNSYVYPVGLNWNDPATFVDVPLCPIEVEIDIKPGSDPNSINPKSKGLIPVAILTTPSFDATTVDAETVRFGPDAATMVHKNAHLEDADGDGDIDMILHFKTQETGIQAGDTEATLTGETVGGQLFEGTDSVRTVGKP